MWKREKRYRVINIQAHNVAFLINCRYHTGIKLDTEFFLNSYSINNNVKYIYIMFIPHR